jgi:hypothetical protein
MLALQLRGSRTRQELNRRAVLEQTRALRASQRHIAVLRIGLHCEQAADFEWITTLMERLFDPAEEVQHAAAEALKKAMCSSWDEKAEALLPSSRVVTTLLSALERKNAPVPTLLDVLAALARRCPHRAEEITLSLRALSRKDARLRYALQYWREPGSPAPNTEYPTPHSCRPEELARNLPGDFALLQHRDPAQRYRAALRLHRAEQAGYRLIKHNKTLVAVKIQDLSAFSERRH